MNSFVSLLGAGVDTWMSESFPIIRLVIVIIIAVLALAMILAVLVQPSASNGANPITGQSETFYGKNKSHTLEGFWKKLTVGIAITIAVLAVLYFVTYMIYSAGV